MKALDKPSVAISGLDVDKGKFRLRRSFQRALRADRPEKSADGMIARQHEVIAIVDHEPDSGIEVRAAAPAGLARLLVHDDVMAPLGEAHRRRQAGNTGADHVNRA